MPRRRTAAWVLWDWATQPLNTVLITFVFVASYLTSDAFLAPEVAALGQGDPTYDRALAGLASNYGYATALAGIVVALLAPVLGQRADVNGTRKAWLAGTTALLALSQFALFFVEADPRYFWYGAIMIGLMQVIQEIAGVNYNAMIVQVATPKTVGKVSGLGWAMGYLGGIVALLLVVVVTSFEWFGMDTSNGFAFRVIAVGCGIWTVVFAWPIFVHVPAVPPRAGAERVGFFRGYVVLARDVKELWRHARPTLWFLVASAVYRDGLTGVFQFGAVIAVQSFGFSDSGKNNFGLVALLVAGLASFGAGWFDDRFGSKRVISVSLVGLLVAGTVVLVFHPLGAVVFWVAGLFLCLFVGPAQAASRSFLSRVTPAGRESEVFGLYATTGRAASFLTPLLWAIVIDLTGATIWGTVAILAVVLLGYILLRLVKEQPQAVGTQ